MNTITTANLSEMSFVPKDLVTIQVGYHQAAVYMKLDPSWPDHERAHAYQVVKSALEPLPVDMRLILDAMGSQLNCPAIVDGLIMDFLSFFDERWYNFNNLVIQSFHDSSGGLLNNTTTAENASILLPVQDGNIPACRQPDVRFVRVLCTIDFAELITAPDAGVTILRIGFYIELPQSTRAMTNGVGNAYNLTTWLGEDDLSTMTADNVRALILEPTLQDGPIALRESDYNLTEANIDSKGVRETINAKILQLGFKQICASIFQQLCPGYSDQPHAALEHIRQSAAGPDGQLVTASVVDYYQRMLNAMRPFATQKEYPISVCDRFIRGLDRRIVAGFRRMYPLHSAVHALNGSYQRQQLAIILRAAQAAEDEVHQVQDIARGMIGQGFLTEVVGAGAYPSQAEATIQKYKNDTKGGGMGTRKPLECWGCGGDHSWMKAGKISCPRGSDPAVIAKAKERYEAYKASGGRSRGYKGKKGRSVEYKDMNEQQQKKMREAVLAITAAENSSVASAITHSSNESSTKIGQRVFMMVPVFSSVPPARRVLPVPLQPSFPHITLVLGQDINSSSCPAIRCVIDTAAALSTGNLHFFAGIAKAYPETVAAIHSAADFSPIILSGIVQQGGESVTTELTVAFHFHLPYLTREGNSTSLLVATGPNVTVNTILGLPFIQQTKMIIDASDQVAELRALDTPPFPIDFRRAMCTVPDVKPKANPIASHADVIREVERIEQFYAAEQHTAKSPPTSIMLPAKRAREVTSGTEPTSPAAMVKTVSFGSAIEPSYSVEADPDGVYDVPAFPA